MAARKSARLQVLANDRSLLRAVNDAPPVEEVDEDVKGIIVQTKYDGDRLQAHVVDGDNIKLFTRRGFDVTDLYSDIARALSGGWAGEAPCVLDGELIVVDKTDINKPLPWSNEKWRHNHRNAEGIADSPFIHEIPAVVPAVLDDDVICVEYSEATLSRNWDETEHNDAITFINRSSLSRYAAVVVVIQRDIF